MEKKSKFNYIGWSLIFIGALIIMFSFVFMQDSPVMCSCSAPAISSIITSSFLTFGVGMAMMMIGFARLYTDRWNNR
jgi:hypothetical protein